MFDPSENEAPLRDERAYEPVVFVLAVVTAIFTMAWGQLPVLIVVIIV